MNIGQFLLIFWARRGLIAAATACCLVGALIVTMLIPAQWEGRVRIILNTLKPDPVTGEILGGPSGRTYVDTQLELFTDYSVVGNVVEKIGWLSDPNLAAQYDKRPSNDRRDFRHWLADRIIVGTKAKLVEGSNIVEVTYTAPSPDVAKKVAELLRETYMETALEFKREDARHNTEWYADQANKAKQVLDAAVAAEAAYERANGVVMSADKVDLDSAHLQALTMQSSAPMLGPIGAQAPSGSAVQLASLDAELAAARKTLGPNHPEILDLQAKRAALVSVVAKDQAAARAADARASSGGAGAISAALAAQKAKVIGQSEKVGRLTQLHQDVELARDQYLKMSSKTTEFREEAASNDIGVTTLGGATVPKEPKFPNYMLIVPGSLMLGFSVGVLVSLLMELVRRRVRSPEDLEQEDEVPVITVIPTAVARARALGLIIPELPFFPKRRLVNA